MNEQICTLSTNVCNSHRWACPSWHKANPPTPWKMWLLPPREGQGSLPPFPLGPGELPPGLFSGSVEKAFCSDNDSAPKAAAHLSGGLLGRTPGEAKPGPLGSRGSFIRGTPRPTAAPCRPQGSTHQSHCKGLCAAGILCKSSVPT